MQIRNVQCRLGNLENGGSIFTELNWPRCNFQYKRKMSFFQRTKNDKMSSSSMALMFNGEYVYDLNIS